MEFNATFLVAAVSFIAFTLIMEKIFYSPISKIIEKRKAYFDDNNAETQANHNAAKKLRDDKDNSILASKTEAKNTIMSEVEKANLQKFEREQSLKSEIQKTIAAQKDALNNEKNVTSSEMQYKLDDVSNSILAKLTGGDK